MVQRVNKIIKLGSRAEIIKFQLIIYAFCNDLKFSEADLDTITFILDKGFYKGIFQDIKKLGYFSNAQSARNVITRANKIGLLLDNKEGYKINPSTQINTSDQILLDIKVHNLNLNESKK